MKGVSYAIMVAVLGICSTSEGISEADSPYISYWSAEGKLKKERLKDVNENTFQNMSDDSLEQISWAFLRYQRFVDQSTFPPKETESLARFPSLRASIASNESEFLIGTEKDSAFLQRGYSRLADISSDDEALAKFDDNLRAVYVHSSNANLCRELAETCKELALSSEQKEDFIKAAFWFRMLYAAGEHSSYLQEYENMCYKAGLR